MVCLVAVFLACSSATVQAETVFEDTFEVASASPPGWQTVRNAQDALPQQPCLGRSGENYWNTYDHKLGYAVLRSPACVSEILPNSSLVADLPDFMMSFTTAVSEAEEERAFLLRWGSAQTWLRIETLGNMFWVRKRINGVDYPVLNAEGNGTWKLNEVNTVQIRYLEPEGRVWLWLNGQEVLHAQEQPGYPRITTGKPGLMIRVENKPTAYSFYDAYRIEIPPYGPLRATNWKQTDDRWRDNHYDHTAHSIQEMGCALTSAAMLLTWHGVTTVPDTQVSLDPGSLNRWLIDQSDGYWPSGLLNWRALTRLSAQAAASHPGAYSLEYFSTAPTGTSENKLTWLHNQVKSVGPVVLQEPNHFILADAFDSDQVLIRDPAFEHENLAAYRNDFLSARVFTPSHTDLRAITLGYPVTTQVTWQYRASNQADWHTVDVPKVHESIGISDSNWIVTDLAKPDAGEYRLTFSLSTLLPQQLALHTYNQDGTVNSRVAAVSTVPKTWKVTVAEHSVVPQVIPASPSFPSAAIWSAWLSWGEVWSPWVWQETLHHWNALQIATELSAANQHTTSFVAKLEQWRDNDWISQSVYSWLVQWSRDQLLALWP